MFYFSIFSLVFGQYFWLFKCTWLYRAQWQYFSEHYTATRTFIFVVDISLSPFPYEFLDLFILLLRDRINQHFSKNLKHMELPVSNLYWLTASSVIHYKLFIAFYFTFYREMGQTTTQHFSWWKNEKAFIWGPCFFFLSCKWILAVSSPRLLSFSLLTPELSCQTVLVSWIRLSFSLLRCGKCRLDINASYIIYFWYEISLVSD